MKFEQLYVSVACSVTLPSSLTTPRRAASAVKCDAPLTFALARIHMKAEKRESVFCGSEKGLEKGDSGGEGCSGDDVAKNSSLFFHAYVKEQGGWA